ncbi:WD repeat domain 75 [Rhodotorula toruloides]|uniref:WD repeat domain 75 n=1 Tax=Rhodotorula toruloides TaxID=5286 RepID=A0A511KCQ3_RHOTO|nr:WD repeat domain 75 [Rhodotorula toruloides]
MATVAPATAALAARQHRQRPNRSERKLIRAELAAHLHEGTAQGPVERQRHLHVHAQRDSTALGWLPLAHTVAATCPVVFSPDGSYCFIASGSAVKIYSVRTTQLMSTLSISPYASSSSSQAPLQRATVSAVLLSPSNRRQLVVASTDGKVRLWDYLEGRLLRTLEMGAPVVHATANANLPDQLYVALEAPREPEALAKREAEAPVKRTAKRKALAKGPAVEDEPKAGVYLVSLRAARTTSDGVPTRADPSHPVPPARRVRLAVPRVVRALALSPDGSVLASVNPHAINLCRTSEYTRGFTQTVPAENESLTTIAFHPSENYFATGNRKGQIRLWYNVLSSPLSRVDTDGDLALSAASTADSAPSTSVLHWHAHAVSSLAFTPNGAYLLSGGQEAVLVLWQLHTGHQEYVPRLGAPIATLSVLDGTSDSGEQQVAARLRDGSVVFIGSQKLRIAKTISGLKANAASLATFAPARPDAPTPLALDPSSSSLVLPASHPSSLQFYSPLDDAQLLEVEVSPSNRVSSATSSKPIEPTRVERVAFSNPNRRGEYWMATVDSWERDGFAPVRQLKVWKKRADASSFVLSTRVDRPHDTPITSLSFSPSPTSPLLLTTSTDGRIKVWSHTPDGSWRCRASLLHRKSAPVAAAWSADGSMFAVAHFRSVSLWSLANTGELIHSFPATNVGRPRQVEFVNEEGTALMVAGSAGSLCWDLLTLEETFSSTINFSSVARQPKTNALVAVEDTTSLSDASLLYILDPSASIAPLTRPLSVPARQILPLPSTSTSSFTSASDISLAVASTSGDVALVGAAARAGGSIAPTRLPTAIQGTTRLFDEIFGSEDLAASSEKGKGKARAVEGAPVANDSSKSPAAILLETPAHSLPPVRLLWRDLIGVGVSSSAGGAENGLSVGGGRAEGADSAGQGQPRVQGDWSVAEVFSPTPVDALSNIFGARLGLEAA